MPLQKARKLIALMLRAYGASQEAIDELFGLYAFRRILPTLAHQSNFSTEERLDVGGWTDPAAKTRIDMPALYSSAHSFRQISLKSELVEMATSALALFHTSSKETTINPSWETIFGFWPKRGDRMVLPIIMDPEPKKAQFERTVKEPQKEDDDGTSSCSSTSSFWKGDTAQPAPDEDDEIDEPYPQELSITQWKISTGKKGCVHIVTKDGVLACGRSLRGPEEGIGLSQAYNSGRPISPRCFKALSSAGQRWWKDIENM